MNIQEFMNHSNRGGKRQYLKDWKKEPPHAITVWLSTTAPILALWRHSFCKVVPKENPQTKEKTREVWTDRLVCFESEEVLKEQYLRDKDSGERVYPPVLCPICKMLEWLRASAKAGKLDSREGEAWMVDTAPGPTRGQLVRRPGDGWLRPIFKFEGTDPSKTKFLHAGGMYKAFGNKKMGDEDKRAMAAVAQIYGGPLYQRFAWTEDLVAKLEYALTIVNNDDAAKGCQIAIEANLLGDKLKKAMQDRAKALLLAGQSAERADPSKHPYAFRFEHNPTENIPFDEKYSVFIADQVRLTPAVDKAIRSEAPDLTELAKKFNPESVLATMERHALVKLPFGEFFKDAIAWSKGQKTASTSAAVQGIDRAMGAAEGAPTSPVTQANPQPSQAPVVVDGEEVCACEKCGKASPISATSCPHCGVSFDVVSDPDPVPAPGGPTIAAPAAPSVLGGFAPQQETGGEQLPGDPDDDIPF